LIDPGVSLVEGFNDQRDVLRTKTVRTLPVLSVSEGPGDGYVVAFSAFGLIEPDRTLDTSNPDLMHGLVAGGAAALGFLGLSCGILLCH